jgi:hypothetical protein
MLSHEGIRFYTPTAVGHERGREEAVEHRRGEVVAGEVLARERGRGRGV